MSEELKPCPSCGSTDLETESGFDLACPILITHSCRLVDVNKLFPEEWNSAFAWKEIDRYKSLAEKHLRLAATLAAALEKVAYESDGYAAAACETAMGALSLAREMLAKDAHDKGVLK
jgi:hypothetical protein